MRKRDLAFVAACITGALLFGVWSVRLGVDFYRSQHGATDLSSSRRQAAPVEQPAPPGAAHAKADERPAP